MAVVKDAVYHHILIDDATGLPRFWGNAWMLQRKGALWKPNSILKKLRNLDRLYRFTDVRYSWCYLDDAIAAKNPKAIFGILETFLAFLTPISGYRDAEVEAWDDAVQFVEQYATPLAITESKWRRFVDSVKRLGRLKSPTNKESVYVRSLPPETLENFLNIVATEPETLDARHLKLHLRNRLIVALLLSAGLRRGELLMLTIDSLVERIDRKSGTIKRWLNVRFIEDSEEDGPKRHSAPSLKSTFSRRQVPVGEDLGALYTAYVLHGRGGAATETLILSNRGNALSAEGLNWLFRAWSACMSKEAKQALADVTGGRDSVHPHDLRHTSANSRYVFLREKHSSLSLVYQKMRRFYGWSKDSRMPELYAEAAIEEEIHEIMAMTTELRVAKHGKT